MECATSFNFTVVNALESSDLQAHRPGYRARKTYSYRLFWPFRICFFKESTLKVPIPAPGSEDKGLLPQPIALILFVTNQNFVDHTVGQSFLCRHLLPNTHYVAHRSVFRDN